MLNDELPTCSVPYYPPVVPQGPALPILYSCWLSSCSWRVRIVLNLKDIPYETKPIDLVNLGGEQHSGEYRRINPMEQVPALKIDGHTLIESMAIMHYLDETWPHCRLLPLDAYRRAKVREICEIICSGIQPLHNQAVLIYVGEGKKREWSKYWINRGLRAVERLLIPTAGKYCMGNEITMADCCLVPQIFAAQRLNIGVNRFPTIMRISRALADNPAFVAAHPFNQPDCPPEAERNRRRE